MPELSYAFLANYVRTEGGLAHVIGAGIDTVWAAKVPTGHNLAIVARITFTTQECERPHRLEIIFQDEDGQRLATVQSVVTPHRSKGLPAHWPQGWIVGLNLGIPLPRYGLYSFEVMVDDGTKGTLPLRVVPASERPTGETAPDAPAGQ